jgi:uncharacterized protein YbjT (DUF2867 family)
MNILVLGGSGFVGRALLEELQRAGHRATVPTRHAQAARELGPLPGVTVLRGDVLAEPGLLERLLPGHDAVVNLIAILQGSEAAFDAVHVQWPKRLGAACVSAGLPRLLHVSALGVSADAPSRYLRSKARGEQALHAMQQHGGLQLTVLRPSVIFGARDRFLNLFARLQQASPLMPLAGANARFQPVWVGDVAAGLRAALEDPASVGQTYEAAGPEVHSLAELVRLAGRVAGCERPIVPLPGPLATLQALALECLPGEPLMSRDNLASMTVPNVASGQLPGLERLGVRPQRLAAIVPGYLAPEAGPARLNPLRARR